jgi:hypothetical protein
VTRKVRTLFVDDIDGSTAEGTVRFGLDGAEYEIDLNTRHAAALREALAQYIETARRSPAGGGPGRNRRHPDGSGLNVTEVREWAKRQGIEVEDRRRIPAELVVRFKATTGN